VAFLDSEDKESY
jgi:hypothetical protein